MTYYKEELEKDTRYRAEYAEGLEIFLRQKQAESKEERSSFIDPEKYEKDPAFYHKKFIDMLGFPLCEQRSMPVLNEKTFVTTDGNVHIYRIQFCFFGTLKFYGLYFEQTRNKEKQPFIIGLHGGDGTPELVSSMHLDSANYNHLIRRMTDKGANVFVPQLLLWNKEIYGGEYERLHIDGKLRQLGGSMTALEIYLMQGCIDYFLEKEGMNANKLGVAGLSYGGMYSVHLAAVDTRIKACYSCSWVNDSFVHSWADWSYRSAQKLFTTAETLAMICPRPLVVAMGDKDRLFDYRLTKATCEETKKYYAQQNKSDYFKCVIFNGEHETDKAEEELEFLFQHLK